MADNRLIYRGFQSEYVAAQSINVLAVNELLLW